MKDMEVKRFDVPDIGNIRAVYIQGEPWFVAKDVCNAIGVGNAPLFVKGLDDAQKKRVDLSSSGGKQNTGVISKDALIEKLAKSRKEKSEKILNWVRKMDDIPVSHAEENTSIGLSEHLQVLNIDGIDCYEKDGIIYLKLDAVARGLGFTFESDGKMYVRWNVVRDLLAQLIPLQKSAKVLTSEDFTLENSYIPENVFYRLAMKANSETANAFQAKIADDRRWRKRKCLNWRIVCFRNLFGHGMAEVF